ncbi:MAG: pseudouridylate synthase [Clostridia bacterium]|jgi:23S rRNA pseudouridine1911/1915/1917 synthase|nr:pseudouridylate synthase [Clostridia bacterium]
MKKEITAELANEKLNIKEFLESCCSLSSRKVKQLLKQKKILINNKTAYYDSSVRCGDRIVFDMSETHKDSTVPEEIPLDIVYEDEYYLAVNKPAGILVHPTQNHPCNTLANGVKFYFLSKGLDIPVRLANRIDMDTSGLVIIAKSGMAHSAIAEQFKVESCKKIYIAIAEGHFEPAKGTIDKPIGIDDENPIRRAIRDDGQRCITEYEVVEQYKKSALVRLNLITGRTHQIRVHLSSIGHPLLGDKLYNGSMECMQRQALHAYEMVFKHPYTNKEMKLQAKVPEDMQRLIEHLKHMK